VLDNAEPRLAASWHAVGLATELESAPRAVRLLGQSWHVVGGQSDVQAYDETGRPAHAARIAYGLLWLAPRRPAVDFPSLPELVDPGFAVGQISRRTNVGAGVLIDNFLDVSHFSYLHQETFGRTTPVTTAGCEVDRDGWVLRLRHATDLHEGRPDDVTSAGPDSPSWRIATYTVLAPYVTHLQMTFPATGARSAATLICQAEESGATTVHVLVAWPASDPVGLQEQLDLSSDVLAEDLAVLELMAEPRLELSLSAERHTRADRASVAYRRLMADYLAMEVPAHAAGG
jgi:phenylpropionate dioxygenase-like ring-hydroxylating dioxygenase large terminal subunit